MKVQKRDGSVVPFEKQKIINAINKAGHVRPSTAQKIADSVEAEAQKCDVLPIETIQDMVENGLMASSYKNVAKEYIRYRKEREMIREHKGTFDSILRLIDGKNEYLKTENSNKNVSLASTQRDYMAGEVSKDLVQRLVLPEDIVQYHKEGRIHMHDLDYMIQHIFNCCLWNLEDILQNGTVINGTRIEKPRSFTTACTITTQVAAIVASNQYGGQTFSLTHLAPFVEVSRQKLKQEMMENLASAHVSIEPEVFDQILESKVRDEIKKGVQTLQYQINTIMSSNGQTPFLTVYMYLGEAETPALKRDLALIIEEVLRQRTQGVKNEAGAWITPAFPKLIYVLESDNITEDSPYWYLTVRAAQCTAKRMVPDYISEKRLLELKHGTLMPFKERRDKWGNERIWGKNVLKSLTDEECEDLDKEVTERWNAGDRIPAHYVETAKKFGLPWASVIPRVYPCMGCRSFLTPDPIHYKYYGRFNQGVVTTNIPFVACLAREQFPEDEASRVKRFFEIFEEDLELCHRALQIRHRRLLDTPTETSPVHWEYGAIARFGKDDTITPLLFDNYSTISLGYAGLYEAVMALIGKSHTTKEGHELAVRILQMLNDKCKQWRADENISYSVYGTPIESTTYKFAQALQRRFGVIPEVSDHDYITNSYHINVREPIDPFTKLKLEDEYQALSPGGCISYIETADLTQNIGAVLEVMKFIYEDNIYAELNTKSDYCQVCGYDGEIKIEKEGGRLVWVCPQCGNRDQRKMSVTRRTCGYLGSQFWNQGRTEEIKDRYVHLGSTQEVKI